ncbi:Tyrosine recombinase XerC [subsurface metagenome]
MTTTPKTLTITECHQLLDALLCKQGTQKQLRKGIRNYTMALLMLDAGLRVGEVVQLQDYDLYFNCLPVESIIIRPEIAKNKRERTVPVSTRLSNALKEYSEYFPTTIEEIMTSFVFHRSNICCPLSTRQVERIIRAAAMKSIGRPVHPHMLRHTFGTRLMRKTNSRVVQELLGHARMSSTQIYTHPNSDDLKKAIREVCDDPQEKHLLLTDSSLDSHAADRVDTIRTDQDAR